MIQTRAFRIFTAVIVAVAGLLCTQLPASAQYDTGSIVGIVHDQSGAVVADAKVKVTNTKTGRVYEVTTDSAGNYEVPGLPAGPYEVKAEKTGFKVARVEDIILYATDRKGINVNLPLGTVSEQVSVVADATTVNTQSSETGASIDSNKVLNLPLNGRDFTSLIALVPGAITTGVHSLE